MADDSTEPIGDADYLRRILTARVYDVAIESPLDPAPDLSLRTGNRVLLKREDLQPVFSFKLRGAFNKMASLSAEQLANGVIAASAGNHAQGVALAARELGCTAVIVMPTTTPELKVEAVRALGAEIIQHGLSFTEAGEFAAEVAAERSLTFVHPFDDPDVIAGQGTIGVEVLRQHGAPIDAIFVAIGGGGLISGVAAYLKQIRPDIRVIGVQHAEATAMGDSIAAGERVTLDDVELVVADSGAFLAAAGDLTLEVARETVTFAAAGSWPPGEASLLALLLRHPPRAQLPETRPVCAYVHTWRWICMHIVYIER